MNTYDIISLVIASISLIISIAIPIYKDVSQRKKEKEIKEEFEKNGFSSREAAISSIAKANKNSQKISKEIKDIQNKQANAIVEFSRMMNEQVPKMVSAFMEATKKDDKILSVAVTDKDQEYKELVKEKKSPIVQKDYIRLKKNRTDYMKVYNRVRDEQIKVKHEKNKKRGK